MPSEQGTHTAQETGIVPPGSGRSTVAGGLNYRALTAMAGLGLLALGMLRGFRLPNDYAYTLSLIDYQTGFVKRGLLGQLLHAAGREGYPAFAIAATALLGASMCALGVAIYRVARRDDSRLWAAVLVFATSYAIVYLAHLNGYLDHVGLILTVVVLSIRDWRRQLPAAVAAFALGTLFHEAICVVFAPLVFGVLLVKVRREPEARATRWLVGGALAVLAVVAAVGQARLPRAEAMQWMAQLEAAAGAPINRMGLLSVLAGDYHDTLEFTSRFWSNWRSWVHLLQSLVVVLPTLGFLLYVMRIRLRRVARERWVRFVALVAPLSPLAMHVAGIDSDRWNLLTQVTLFLAVYGISRIPTGDDPAQQRRWNERVVVALVLICLFNGITAVPLFGAGTCHSFPYCEHLYDLLGAALAR